MCVWSGGGAVERESGREKQTDRHTDTQTHRHTHRHREQRLVSIVGAEKLIFTKRYELGF